MELRLRQYKPCDADKVVSWIREERSYRKWGTDIFGDYPLTAERMNDFYINKNGGCAEEYNFYPMTAFDESGAVGHLILRFTDYENNVLRFGFIIVDESRRGIGYGKKMLLLAQKYAFEILKVDKVTLGVFENNAPAYNCYKAAGFKETDTVSFAEFFSEQWKCIDMEVTKKDYEKSPLRY